MRKGMTRLETFTKELDGEIAKGRLEALGVKVLLEKDNIGGMGPQFDQQRGIKLFVADEDVEKAREILSTEPTAATAKKWVCAGCSEEIEGSFDTCWKCGHERG